MDKKFAEFFKTQCIGGYNGHMAEIKFNPVIDAIIQPVMNDIEIPYPTKQPNEYSNMQFAAALRQIADALDPPKQSGVSKETAGNTK